MKVWVTAGVVCFGFVRASLANPLDSRGTVYIDGMPCNVPCQSYMAWSRQTLEAKQDSTRGAASTSVAKASAEAPRKRVSKRVESALADAASRKKKTGDVQTALTAPPEPPPPSTQTNEVAPLNVEAREPPASPSTASEPPPVLKPGTEHASLEAGASNLPKERTPQELVMAALAVAEQITNAETSPAQGNRRPDEATVSTPRVALLICRPDVKSASELKGLEVAFDSAQSVVEQDLRFALVALGAVEVRLSTSNASPLDRLISGDVQAAVVKLVSTDAAEAFPDIKGFKVLRAPLLPR